MIEVYFLPVGHTHGQIDQFFSVYSVYLKRNPAKTLVELRQNLYLAYNNPKKKYRKYTPKKKKKEQEIVEDQKEVPKVPVNTQVIDSVVDFSNWLNDFLVKEEKKSMVLKDSHAFKLVNDSMNPEVVLVFSKQYAATNSWKVFFYFFYFVFPYI